MIMKKLGMTAEPVEVAPSKGKGKK